MGGLAPWHCMHIQSRRQALPRVALQAHRPCPVMPAPVLAEVIRRISSPNQVDLPFATEGVLRYVWESRFGEMLIEVVDAEVRVNGLRVAPAALAREP